MSLEFEKNNSSVTFLLLIIPFTWNKLWNQQKFDSISVEWVSTGDRYWFKIHGVIQVIGFLLTFIDVVGCFCYVNIASCRISIFYITCFLDKKHIWVCSHKNLKPLDINKIQRIQTAICPPFLKYRDWRWLVWDCVCEQGLKIRNEYLLSDVSLTFSYRSQRRTSILNL